MAVWPKVELLDTGGSEVILRNLSQNVVATEEDALNALFIGDTNSKWLNSAHCNSLELRNCYNNSALLWLASRISRNSFVTLTAPCGRTTRHIVVIIAPSI